VDRLDAMVVDWCSAVHDTSGVTAPFTHVCSWCEVWIALHSKSLQKLSLWLCCRQIPKKWIWFIVSYDDSANKQKQ